MQNEKTTPGMYIVLVLVAVFILLLIFSPFNRLHSGRYMANACSDRSECLTLEVDFQRASEGIPAQGVLYFDGGESSDIFCDSPERSMLIFENQVLSCYDNDGDMREWTIEFTAKID